MVETNNLSKYDYVVKIVMIGNAGSGKTSLFWRYKHNSFEEEFPWPMPEFYPKVFPMEDGKRFKMMMWDTANVERFKGCKMMPSFWRNSVGAIVVFDLSNFESFRSVGDWLKELKENCKATAAIYLVGNQSDCDKRAVKREEVEKYAASHGLRYFETSAKTGENVTELFESCASDIYKVLKDTN